MDLLIAIIELVAALLIVIAAGIGLVTVKDYKDSVSAALRREEWLVKTLHEENWQKVLAEVRSEKESLASFLQGTRQKITRRAKGSAPGR